MKMENTRQLGLSQGQAAHDVGNRRFYRRHQRATAKRYPDVEVVFTPERRGKTAALNHGISMVNSQKLP